MTDFEDIARRAFDEPLDADARAALRVWADSLESAGDPRGTLIALELAMRAAPERYRELQHAMTEHLVEHGKGLLGGIAPLLQFKRALELDWRAGRLYGAFLDTRHVSKKSKLSPAQLVEMLLAAPATRSLRRLHVRVRQSRRVAEVLAQLLDAKRPPPLEEIVVLVGVRPTELGGSTRARWLSTYPNLRMLVIDGVIIQLPIDTATEQRVRLGRSLLATDVSLRAGAAERIASLGPNAFMFVDTLLALLEPGIVTPQAPFVHCLRTIGSQARRAVPQLAKITGRTAHYDRETRSVAGTAIASLIAAPSA